MNIGTKEYDPYGECGGKAMFGFIVYRVQDLDYVFGDDSIVTMFSEGLENFLR